MTGAASNSTYARVARAASYFSMEKSSSIYLHTCSFKHGYIKLIFALGNLYPWAYSLGSHFNRWWCMGTCP